MHPGLQLGLNRSAAKGPIGDSPPTFVFDNITNGGSGATSIDISSSGRQAGDLLLLGVSTARQFIDASDITNAGTWQLLANDRDYFAVEPGEKVAVVTATL